MNTPSITESEWNVMEVLWRNAPLSASDVCRLLKATTGWADNTVRTLITRLVEKGALDYNETDKKGREFYPKYPRNHFVKVQSETFLNRIFHGATKQLLVHFSSQAHLTPEDIDELKKILDQAQDHAH